MEDFEHCRTTLQDVQAVLMTYIRPNSILIGHSLDSDLLALKFIHDCVVDTSVLYPHHKGPPIKRALRTLAQNYLARAIQNSDSGHDSTEDAYAALDLVLFKVKGDFRWRR
jgi:RNA exonuclease 1